METLYLTLKDIQEICNEMLKDISCLCEERDISYYVVYGTLLGTIRHKGSIPWDYDVDLYVMENDIDRLIQSINEKWSDKYWVDFRGNGIPPKAFPRIGLKGYETTVIHIDVFRMSGLPNNWFYRKLLTFIGFRLRVIRRLKDYTMYNKTDRTIKAKMIKAIFAPISITSIVAVLDKLCKLYKPFTTDYVGRVMGDGAIFKRQYFESYIMKPYSDFYVRVPVGYEELLTQGYGDYMKFPPEEERLRMMQKIFCVEPFRY